MLLRVTDTRVAVGRVARWCGCGCGLRAVHPRPCALEISVYALTPVP